MKKNNKLIFVIICNFYNNSINNLYYSFCKYNNISQSQLIITYFCRIDADNDGNSDPGKREFIVSMNVPCEE